MPDPRHLRYLAPSALVVFLLAAIIVIATSGGDAGRKDGGSAPGSAAAPRMPAAKGNVKRYYRVRAGDLLSTISQRTKVDVATLIDLNPNVDPQALQTGQLIRIRR
jgi:LysM repeat protein